MTWNVSKERIDRARDYYEMELKQAAQPTDTPIIDSEEVHR